MRFVFLLPLLLCSLQMVLCVTSTESFYEEMAVRPLPDGKVLVHFSFTTRWENADLDAQHYNLFPKSVGQTVQRFAIDELHLSFTQGKWQHPRWGYPIVEAPIGAELWAWLSPHHPQSVDARWKAATHALSGLFCASLQFLDCTVTAAPLHVFAPTGSCIPANTSSEYARYGTLPRELVCTENLTPWKKLLPCKHHAGLATLLNALKLYDVHYHSMSTHYRKLCSGDGPPTLELVQNAVVVFDGKDWSLVSLFDRELEGACPLAEESRVYVQLQRDLGVLDVDYTVTPQPNAVRSIHDGAGVELVYIVNQSSRGDIAMKWKDPTLPLPSKLPVPILSAHRFLTGYGQERGGIAVRIFNNHQSALGVYYYDIIPWYLRLYLHTLKVDVVCTSGPAACGNVSQVMDIFEFSPAEDRLSPATLELHLNLPAKSTTTVSIQFEKVFLRYAEHPPDPSRGFDIGSTALTLDPDFDLARELKAFPWGPSWSPLHEGSHVRERLTIYTESLLISLPTPDFSMPYNVITFTCTVIALFFGSLLNLLLRDFGPVPPPADGAEASGWLSRLRSFIRPPPPTTPPASTPSSVAS